MLVRMYKVAKKEVFLVDLRRQGEVVIEAEEDLGQDLMRTPKGIISFSMLSAVPR